MGVIFANVPPLDLFQLALVCKCWYIQSRSLLQTLVPPRLFWAATPDTPVVTLNYGSVQQIIGKTDTKNGGHNKTSVFLGENFVCSVTYPENGAKLDPNSPSVKSFYSSQDFGGTYILFYLKEGEVLGIPGTNSYRGKVFSVDRKFAHMAQFNPNDVVLFTIDPKKFESSGLLEESPSKVTKTLLNLKNLETIPPPSPQRNHYDTHAIVQCSPMIFLIFCPGVWFLLDVQTRVVTPLSDNWHDTHFEILYANSWGRKLHVITRTFSYVDRKEPIILHVIDLDNFSHTQTSLTFKSGSSGFGGISFVIDLDNSILFIPKYYPVEFCFEVFVVGKNSLKLTTVPVTGYNPVLDGCACAKLSEDHILFFSSVNNRVPLAFSQIYRFNPRTFSFSAYRFSGIQKKGPLKVGPSINQSNHSAYQSQNELDDFTFPINNNMLFSSTGILSLGRPVVGLGSEEANMVTHVLDWAAEVKARKLQKPTQ